MNPDFNFTYARFSFSMIRWAPLVGLIGLPFTFQDGAIAATLVLAAWIIGMLWLGLLMLGWRKCNELLGGLSFIVVLPASHFIEELSNPQSFQWICYWLGFAGLPLVFFPARMRRLARLDETNAQP